jgi:hypothetical protein
VAPKALTVTLFFVQKGELAAVKRRIEPTPAVAAAALRELLAGPTSFERGFGLTTDLPPGRQAGIVRIKEGVLTLDSDPVPPNHGLAFSQLVYTLTQFPTVRGIRFQGSSVTVCDGDCVTRPASPATRRNPLVGVPAILVESPGFGEAVSSPLRVSGSANTFEATFEYELVIGEKIVQKSFVTATSGSGTRGTFEFTLRFDLDRPESGELVVYESSAKDGSRINIREIPLTFEP